MALTTLSQAKEEIQVTLKVEWSEGAQPQKCKVELEKILQTWANKSKIPGDCRVLNVSEDGNAMIRIQSASGAKMKLHIYYQHFMSTPIQYILSCTCVNIGFAIQFLVFFYFLWGEINFMFVFFLSPD